MFLNPQGVEFSRALLEFSEGKKMGLNPQSGRWLAIHVANQYGMDKLSLDDIASHHADAIKLLDEVKFDL